MMPHLGGSEPTGVTVPAHIGAGIKSATFIVRDSRCDCTRPSCLAGRQAALTKLLICRVIQHMLKRPACFPLNLGPTLSMLQCSKEFGLAASGCTSQDQTQRSLRIRIHSH